MPISSAEASGVVLENFAGTLEKAIGGTAVRIVIVTGAGDQLGGAKGLIVNSVVRHVRRAVPAPFSLAAGRCVSIARSRWNLCNRSRTRRSRRTTSHSYLQYTGGTTGVPKGAIADSIATWSPICARFMRGSRR